jgi:hypothetical protein
MVCLAIFASESRSDPLGAAGTCAINWPFAFELNLPCRRGEVTTATAASLSRG